MVLIRKFLAYLVFSLYPNIVFGIFALTKDNPVIGFCHQKIFKAFTLGACPGGIEFLNEDIPSGVCELCFNNLEEVKLPLDCNLKPTVYVSNPDTVGSWMRARPEQVKERLISESQQLLEYRMRMEQQGAKLSSTFETYPKNLRMLDWSQKIFQKVAGRILDSKVIQAAFRLVEYLYHDANPVWQLDTASLKLIMYGLEKCHKYSRPVKTTGFTCRDNSYFDIDDSLNSSTAKSYNKDTNDPLIELMWQALETAHLLCYQHFSFDPKLFHQFQVETVSFFRSKPVQTRWMRNITELELEAYRMVLPGLNENLLKTADALVEEILKDSSLVKIYGNRLVKPEVSQGSADGVNAESCTSGIVLWDGLACCLTTLEISKPSKGWCDNSQDMCRRQVKFTKYG